MNNQETKDLCLQLINCDNEEEVIVILKQHGYWDDPRLWRFYDDNENNFSTIGNQQRLPEAALVEKIINSIDALLINKCREEGINPEDNNAPKSIKEAVAKYFDDNPERQYTGLISEWSSSKRTEIAKNITVAITGETPQSGYPSITISDNGEGQSPDAVPDTFLSLSKSNKLRTQFVQGRFNMGGTGALKFCGIHNLQLILTRRNPALIKGGNESDDYSWGFTIVRRESPSGGRRNSAYTYLAPIAAQINPNKGRIIRFTSNELPIFPTNYKKPYGRPSKYGTLIKLYNYKLSSRTHIFRTSGLLSKLDLLLENPALPIRLYECRDYRGHEGSFETTLTGIQVRLEDDKQSNLEDKFPSTFFMKVDGEEITGKIYAFKFDKSKAYKQSEGILFAVNGQTQGVLQQEFFNRKGYAYLADSLLIVVDCSKMSARAIEDLFMNSRDRLSSSELRYKIEEQLEDEIKNNQLLKDLREKRRRQLIESKVGKDKPLEDVLKKLLNKHQIFTNLFLPGTRLSNPFKTKEVQAEEVEFHGKNYPTFFKLKDKSKKDVLEKQCHINMRCRIIFETDAENDYFDRNIDPGSNEVFLVENGNELPVKNYRMNLQSGIAVLNLSWPENVEVGDKLNFKCLVKDFTRIVNPFINKFTINILREAKTNPTDPNPRRKPPIDKPGNEREIESKGDFPKPIPVYEHEWEKYGFDKFSALKIIDGGLTTESSGDSSIYDYFINMDNIYLKHELKQVKEEPELIKARFKYSLVLVGLGLIQYFKLKEDTPAKEEIEESEDESIEQKVFEVSKALAPILLPLIDSLGSPEMEEYAVSDYSSDVS
ncbi:MAG: hypothetical protein M0Q51_11825 [Bacteroidales bacterium]|nr:hypothetical protein [Bacteroidales bacterium]